MKDTKNLIHNLKSSNKVNTLSQSQISLHNRKIDDSSHCLKLEHTLETKATLKSTRQTHACLPVAMLGPHRDTHGL